jgi:hypothetical protein
MNEKNCTTCAHHAPLNTICAQGHSREWLSHMKQIIPINDCHAWVHKPYKCDYCKDGDDVMITLGCRGFNFCPKCGKKLS